MADLVLQMYVLLQAFSKYISYLKELCNMLFIKIVMLNASEDAHDVNAEVHDQRTLGRIA